MSSTEPTPPKDSWFRDFLRYGAATHTAGLPLYLLPILLILLVVGFLSVRPRAKNSVILYCAQDQVIAEPLIAEFTRRTGIRVRPVFDSEAVKTVGLANRLLAEQGNPVADLFWGNEELRTRQLDARGVWRATNGWTAFGQRTRRLVVPDPAPPGFAPPASLLDLTNARYQGRISLAYPLFGTTATHFLALRQHWGESNWLSWCRALAANRPFIEEGNSHVVRRVARGEAWIGLTDSDDIAAARREGLPVVALPLDAHSLRIPNTVAEVRRSDAIRPEVEQFREFLTSAEVLSRLQETGALESDPGDLTTLAPDWTQLLSELDRGTEQLKDVFQR